jgi:hypothetical protein
MNMKQEFIPETKEVIQHVQVAKRQEFRGSYKPKPGHKFFKYNHDTEEISEAETELLPADFMNPKKVNKRVIMEEGCSYISALNKNNALKKLGITDNGK